MYQPVKSELEKSWLLELHGTYNYTIWANCIILKC